MTDIITTPSTSTGQEPVVSPAAQQGDNGKQETVLTNTPPQGSVLGSGTTPEPSKATDQGQESQGEKSEAANVEVNIKLPEGFNVDEKMLEGFKAQSKDLGLDSEKATKLATWYAQQQQEAEKAAFAAIEKQSNDWEKTLKSDAEFGGAKYAESVQVAQKAVVFCGPELAQELDRLGLGNNPVLAKAFYKIGKAMSEDSTKAKSAVGNNANAPRTQTEIWNKIYGEVSPRNI